RRGRPARRVPALLRHGRRAVRSRRPRPAASGSSAVARGSMNPAPDRRKKGRNFMQELLVDFITSLDGYGAAEGWPGFWGLQGPEYLAWLGEQPERDHTILMGANTYRLMSGFSAEAETLEADEAAAVDELARTPKVVFSSTLQPPLAWANTRLVGGDAVRAVAG